MKRGPHIRFVLNRPTILTVFVIFAVCSVFGTIGVNAEEKAGAGFAISDSSEDIAITLGSRENSTALFDTGPIDPIRREWDKVNAALYDSLGLDLGIAVDGLYQMASPVLPETDRSGFVVDYDFLGRWDLAMRDTAYQGSLYFAGEVRKAYSDTTPALLRNSIGTIHGTSDGFSEQDLRLTNLFWRQGSGEAGWIYQVGRMSADGVVNVSKYNNPTQTFLSFGLSGSMTVAFPGGNGFGAAGVIYPTSDTFVTAVVQDANSRKDTWGELGRGELFKAVEFGYKPRLGESYEGRHAITFWHVDQRKIAGFPSGHGFAVKLEQDLSADGNLIGIFRYSRSFGEAALAREQASAYLIKKNAGPFENDVFGVAAGWVDPTSAGLRNEMIFETFYQFPVTTNLDMTVAVQQFVNLAANPNDSGATVGGIRFRTVF